MFVSIVIHFYDFWINIFGRNIMKKIDVGLIGCGGIANLHMKVLKSMENVRM